MKIAIASGKGGTGKTTIAVNLAALVSREFPDVNVVLADLDVEEPNSGLFLDGQIVHSEVITRYVPRWENSKCTHCGKCSEHCKFNAILRLPEQILVSPELCHSCFACMDLCPENALIPIRRKIGTLVHRKTGEIDLVEGRIEIGEPSAVPLIKKTKEYLERAFHGSSLFILDCPPGNSCPVMESVREVDYVILVAEPTPFGFHDMKIAIETLEVLQLDFGVVINKSGTGDHQIREYCMNNKVRVLGSIKNKKSIAERISKGELLITGFPAVQRALNTIYLAVSNRLHVT